MRDEKVMMVVAHVVAGLVFVLTFLFIGMSFVCMMDGNKWYSVGFMLLGVVFGILCAAVVGEIKDEKIRRRVR
jgi:biotin transporter BioY